jgi:hypothetical protein
MTGSPNVRQHWLALVDTEPPSALRQARVREGGWFAVWDDETSAPETAWRIDPHVLDREGPELDVALAAAEPGVSLPFDDPAVTGAIRSAPSSEPAAMCTTLMDRSGRYGGVLISPPFLATPFATIFPQRTLHVAPGLFGPTPWPTGPGTQRYVGDVPWPYDSFAVA